MCLLDLFWGNGVPLKCMSFFGGISFGRSNMKKRGDHQNKKLFINQSVKVLIPLKEEHQSSKLY